jgi:hypothetical protein
MRSASKETDTRERILEVGAQAISDKSFNSCGLAEILQRGRRPEGLLLPLLRLRRRTSASR